MARESEQKLLKAFGKRVADVRKSKGIKQQELAEAVSMDVVSISYIENGNRWVRLSTLDKLAKALEVKRADLLDF